MKPCGSFGGTVSEALSGEKFVFLIDIDGTIVEDVSNEVLFEWLRADGADHSKPIPEAIERINALYREGHYICLFTARWSSLATITERRLVDLGLKFHSIIYDKPRMTRPDGTRYDGYFFIDNHKPRAAQFLGSWEFKREKRDVIILDGEGSPS
jgi:hypothetical protein